MSMSEWAEDQDPYEILGLAQGHESTEAQIKKVWQNQAQAPSASYRRDLFATIHLNVFN